jgi:hypothetical protein
MAKTLASRHSLAQTANETVYNIRQGARFGIPAQEESRVMSTLQENSIIRYNLARFSPDVPASPKQTIPLQ